MSRILEAKPLEGHRVHLRFDDGAEGVIDIASIVALEGVFEPLRDRSFFEQVRVDPDFGCLYWPNEADLDPDVLHSLVTGTGCRRCGAPVPDRELEHGLCRYCQSPGRDGPAGRSSRSERSSATR